MPPDDTAMGFVRDMLEYARYAVAFTSGKSRDDIHTNAQLAFAVTRALEVLGEAAAQVPPTFRDRYPAVPWRSLVGMRNVLIHGYTRVDYEQLWDIATEQVPPLIEQLQAILDAESRGGE